MTDFVHSLILWSIKRAVTIDSVLFEEKPYLIARGQEVIVTNMVVNTRDKSCLLII